LASNNLGELVLPDGWSIMDTYLTSQKYVHADGREQKDQPDKPEGIIALANAIPDMGAILSVNLLKNKIGVVQAKALASILKEHPTLKSLCGNSGKETELNMSGKEMDAGDAIMVVREIVDNGALTSLNLSSNNLEAEGGKVVAEAIKVTNNLMAVVLAPFSCPSDHWLN
jgi:hypothetical protein